MDDVPVTVLEESSRILGEESTPQAIGNILVPVALQSLMPETVLGFRVYVHADGGQFLIHGRTETFTALDRDRLLQSGQATVYVPQEDQSVYQLYLEAHLSRILGDARIPEPVKADLIYRSSQGLVQEILERPDDPRIVVRAEKAAEATVEYVLQGRDSVQNIIRSCSFDYRTYTHSVNVCIFCIVLARRVGLGEDRLPELATAALLHDIGKSRVDPAILNKKGPLSPPEWDVMRQHPGWGVDLVSIRDGVTPTMCDVILGHHEKLDGSGYPNGMQAECLPLEVRICTICDIFDALTTNRSYKAAMGSFDAITIMHREMQGRIDGKLLQKFIEALKGQE